LEDQSPAGRGESKFPASKSKVSTFKKNEKGGALGQRGEEGKKVNKVQKGGGGGRSDWLMRGYLG